MEPERDPQHVQRSRKWGHGKGYCWASLDVVRSCTRHRLVVSTTHVFHGRRVTVVFDRRCKRRALLTKGRKNVFGLTYLPPLEAETFRWSLRP